MSGYLTKKMLDPALPTTKRKDGDGVLRRWLRLAIRRWQRHGMIKALRAMDDRLLQDIGIIREDIEHVVDGFVDRELRMTPVAPAESAHETCRKAA